MEWLMKPWSLADMTLRNRIWMAPVKTGFGTPEGRVTERHLHFYRRVAQGGVGLVLIEPVPVCWEGREHPKQLAITAADSVFELSKSTAVIHEGGAKAGINLNRRCQGTPRYRKPCSGGLQDWHDGVSSHAAIAKENDDG